MPPRKTVSQLQYASFQRAVKEMLAKVDREHVQDPKLWRQVQFLTTIGPAALPPHLLDRYNRLINDMLTVYDTATICAYNDPFKCGLKLEPDPTLLSLVLDWIEDDGESGFESLSGTLRKNEERGVATLQGFNNFSTISYDGIITGGTEEGGVTSDLQSVNSCRDWDELQYVWTEWRRKSGQKIRDLYEQLVELSNQAAKLNSE
uniref:Uncharacterized protein n=1 Tax=Timema shepardi TaxID=629360 RepID=A0A7R9AT34_TIMSH|nr:unnamed protein product [Timema shepardi]